MSSSRNTKRKRSKSGAPTTASTRERDIAPDSAHDASAACPAEANSDNTSGIPSTSITSASKVTGRTGDSGSMALHATSTDGTILQPQPLKESTEREEIKNEATVANTETGKRTASNSITNRIPKTTSVLTMLSIDASSSCTSSQDGTSTRRQALHIGSNENSREKRMRDLIYHRSVLLERVRACRASAENRIGEKSEGENNTTNDSDLSDNQEIAAFRTMTKQANQAARKNRDADGFNEKRTSLSLRRGSSVGKRMNAALSSLVPGSNIGVGGANLQTAGQETPTNAEKNSSINNSHSSESKSEEKGVSPPFTKFDTSKPSSRLPTNNISNNPPSTTTIQAPAPLKSNANSKLNKIYSPFPLRMTKQSEAQTRGRPPNNKNTKLIKTGTSQIGTATVQYSLAAIQNVKTNSSLTIGARSINTKASASLHLSSSKSEPKVKFPEAITLREKMSEIESKLRNLIERRQNDASMIGRIKMIPSSSLEDENTRRKGNSGVGVIAKPLTNNKKVHAAIKNNTSSSNPLVISPPAPLPNRRRTHWDTVLQEMSWLASDFMEERKWKLSASRLLSSDIPLHGISDRRKRSSEANLGNSEKIPREVRSDSIQNSAGIALSNALGNHNNGVTILEEKHRRHKYFEPVVDEEDKAKCRGKILSCMISNLGDAMKKEGILDSSDIFHDEALKKFITSRSNIIRDAKDFPLKKIEKESNIAISSASCEGCKKKDKKSPSFNNIDDYLAHFHSMCKSKHKLMAKEMVKALKCGKIKLSIKQKEMLEFVDKLWSADPHSGAVIFGSSISGTTFGTAATIWKQRTRGSQILICPSRSLIRWKFELNRFSNIRILTFGSTGGISNPDSDNSLAEIRPSDVILCEYGSISRMKKALKKMGVSPFSVIVDLRHFVGLRKSLRSSTSACSKDFPSEVLSNSWWADIVALVRKKEVRCLFLEYYDTDTLSLSNCGLGQKEHIGILAKRAACVIGPDVFDSGSHSIEREIISWARKKGKHEITDKVSRVRKVICDALNPMCFHATKSVVPVFDFKWELRSCRMSTVQRQEYERCCNELRGALSSTVEESNFSERRHSNSVVSKALLRLRKLCFYSKKHAIGPDSVLLDNLPSMTLTQHAVLSATENKNSNFLENSSQPDADKAYSLLESSSKLKELLSILTNEGGYSINFDESTQKMFGIFSDVNEGNNEICFGKKILIFAALPDIQQAVSGLLNSLGIENELLNRYETCVKAENCDATKSINYAEIYESVAWAKCQRVLSRFSSEEHHRKTNIVIASPGAFCGRNDGIGIEGADMIIALDSDWSRRDGFVVNSLIRRWYAKNKLAGKEDKLIRLVCAESIEAKVFHHNENWDGVLTWPMDIDGFFTLPVSQDEASTIYKQMTEDNLLSHWSFPALWVSHNRGYSLKDVLSSSSSLSSLFGCGKPAIFLPRNHDAFLTDQGINAELQFLKHFIDNEKLGSTSCNSNTVTNLKITSQMSSTGVISLRNISVLESRLFLEKLVNSYSPMNDFEDSSIVHSLHSNVLLLNVAKAQGQGSNKKIDENPSSLLFYEPYHLSLSNSNGSLANKNQSRLNTVKFRGNSKRRYNAYAKLFSSSWNGISVRDGNQGCEPLVFFPPLFPLLESTSKKAKLQYTTSTTVSIEATMKSSDNSEGPFALKRKDRDFVETQNDIKHESKRPKTQYVTEHDIRGYPDPVHAVSKEIQGSTSMTLHNPTEKLLTQNGSAQINSPSSEKASQSIKRCSLGQIMAEEDFGLLGSGAISTPIDVASFSAYDAKVNGPSISVLNRPDYGSYEIPCDAEETSIPALKHMDEGLQSVLLFVRRQSQPTQASYKHGQASSNIVSVAVGMKPTVDDSGKKMKKRGTQGNSQMAPTAFTRLPANLGNQQSQILQRAPLSNPRQLKSDFRHKLLASFYARQRATGLTLFDSIPYRIAATHVEKRVTQRFEKVMWKSTITLDAGPGLPMELVEKMYSRQKNQDHRSDHVVSAVDHLMDGCSPGSAARKQSRLQKLELKGSLVSPRWVDFGSFGAGYLASPSGMTGIPTSRFRVGVSLPMGVKVIQPTKDQQKRSSWSDRDDKILQDAQKKFGPNWQLVASATSGFENAVIKGNLSGIENTMNSVVKSACQCRDRWQILFQSQQIANKGLMSEKQHSEDLKFKCDAVENIDVGDKKGNALVYSADRKNIICNSDDFLEITEHNQPTSDSLMSNVDRNHNSKQIKESATASPRSTVDKNDSANGLGSNQIKNLTTNNSSNAAKDGKEEKRRSFSAISNSRSRKQIFPITIPGIDVGVNQASHPVPSHHSHMQSVQISVAAQCANGRTEMWPLQILDLADKQRSGTARINNMQRGEIPASHNASRRHPPGTTSYQHRSQPSQSSAVRSTVGYTSGLNSSSRPVAQRAVPQHHQHRNPQVTAATVQAYIPPQTGSTGKLKKNDKQKLTNKTNPKKG